MTVEKIIEKIDKLESKKSDITIMLNHLYQELGDKCTHKDTYTRNIYVDGGYLNVSEYHDITECRVCGKELSDKITYGNHA